MSSENQPLIVAALAEKLQEYLLHSENEPYYRIAGATKLLAALLPQSAPHVGKILSHPDGPHLREVQFSLLCSLAELVDTIDNVGIKQMAADFAFRYAMEVNDNIAHARWMAVDLLLNHYEGADKTNLLQQLHIKLAGDRLALWIEEGLSG